MGKLLGFAALGVLVLVVIAAVALVFCSRRGAAKKREVQYWRVLQQCELP
ncbi:MAG: hypothetical protein KGL39_10550 [Patescibacteria group bacterium]|nr:hypothetical protein [Patescibacteria group bacterium]